MQSIHQRTSEGQHFRSENNAIEKIFDNTVLYSLYRHFNEQELIYIASGNGVFVSWATLTMDSHRGTRDKPNDNGFYTCNDGVILLVADETEKSNIKDLLDENYDPSVNRSRLPSVGESSLTSDCTSNWVPSFLKEDLFADYPVSPPLKEVKHRRNRHVFASCCQKSSKSPRSNEKSVHRRLRNRAWNETDFASFMGLSIFSKDL
jgi:hypothetical protein